jgi:hypothetical protein
MLPGGESGRQQVSIGWLWRQRSSCQILRWTRHGTGERGSERYVWVDLAGVEGTEAGEQRDECVLVHVLGRHHVGPGSDVRYREREHTARVKGATGTHEEPGGRGVQERPRQPEAGCTR